MEDRHIIRIAQELDISPQQVTAVARLIDESATVPFIARYRKEATGALDEVVITLIRDRMAQLEELDRRRETILGSLKERELLTDELKEKIFEAEKLATLEDIYLPYRPKKRTRATTAREKGLEPLADRLFAQEEGMDPPAEAKAFVNPEKDVETIEAALAGARDIMAEWVNENQDAREKMRALYMKKGLFQTKVVPGKEEEGRKFRDYFDLQEAVSDAPSHRVLAMRRGEKEGFLDLEIGVPEEAALAVLESLFLTADNPASMQVRDAVHDSYNRLLAPAMETEIRMETKRSADTGAIRIFAENLRELLLAPPLGQKSVLAIDPGIRTGCKLVCLNQQGKLLHKDTIYLFQSENQKTEATQRLSEIYRQFGLEAVAVGNGTGGRETASFLRDQAFSKDIPILMVNESGASVYSASKVARDEFPDLDLTFRGSVSIGRRLMDPLAELVKIDPKSIGVGQYQHDVNQPALKRSLDDVVISCVNAVGVEVNTASEQLLSYVSGLGAQLAKNMVAFRDENGPFSSRAALKKVKRLGSKAFEQAAGFLRIKGGKNPLDASAVHPESYPIVKAMAGDLNCKVEELLHDEALRRQVDLSAYVSENVGMPTLKDIMDELEKPGRDPRKQLENFGYTEGIDEIEDLKPGMKLPGVVTNVTAFGAFVDLGVHQDGLVHISQLADRYVKDPTDVVKVNQQVTVTVLEVDLDRKRISLSMKENPSQSGKEKKKSKKPPKPQKTPQKHKKGEKQAFNNPFAQALKKG